MTTKQVTLIAMTTSLATVAIIAALLWVTGVAGAGPLASNGGSVPRLISYQGRLTDAAGNPLTGSYNMTFCLYDVATGGTSLWCETQAVNVSYGVFNALLGSVNSIPTTAFSGQNLYLGVRVGSDSEMTPRKRVVSVGYAYKAEDASTLQGLQPSAFASASQAVPAGAIIMWSGASCPPGWTRVADLDDKFPMGGTTYGTTGGSTTHNHGGATASHTLIIAEMPSHTHTMTNANSDAGSGKPATGGDQPEGGDLVTNSTGGGQGHSHDIQAANHLPPYITVLFCRKD